jgi:hypothetical protein
MAPGFIQRTQRGSGSCAFAGALHGLFLTAYSGSGLAIMCGVRRVRPVPVDAVGPTMPHAAVFVPQP